MYHGRRSLRWMVYLGTLGLAGLMPGRAMIPAWVAVGACCLPIALFELGAGLVVEARGARWRSLGRRLQLAGAVVYLALLAFGLATHPPGLRGLPWIVAVASLGLLATGIVWWDALRQAQAREPVANDPFAAGDRLAARDRDRPVAARAGDALAVVGGTPLIIGAIGFGFAAVAAFVALRRPGAPREVFIGIAFFAGCGLAAAAQGLERWEAFVPGSGVARARVLTQLAAFLLFGGALVSIGWLWIRDSSQSRLKSWLTLVGGALILAGGVVYVARIGAARLMRGRRRGVGYHLVREGLLERTRRSTFIYPWEAIEDVSLGELHGNMAMFVILTDDRLVQLTGARAASRLRKRLRGLRWTRDLFGADLLVLDVASAVAVGDLYRTAEAALADPEAREALPSAAETW